MQIVTYLGFTLLSIFIQFSVIDFIQGRIRINENKIDLKGTSQRRQLRDVLKDVTNRPHALFYQMQNKKEIKKQSPANIFTNLSLTEFVVTTDLTSTVYDILYDENTTMVTEETYTTESLYTGIDIENVTEVTFFEKNNETAKSHIITKKRSEDCPCDYLYQVCDINCCCDSDCTDIEIELFPHCDKNKSLVKNSNSYDNYCITQSPYHLNYGSGLFCIVKVNLPEKTNLINKKSVQLSPNHFFAWKSNGRPQILYEFSNTIYKYGDPIWLLKNGTIYHTDLPLTTVNNYCTGRKAIQFLKNEKYSCSVKIRDLEMFQILKSLEEVTVISATPLSINSSVLNCTNFHCVNWTILVCYNLVCSNFSKSLHDPVCTETICKNLAFRIDYIFYYNESKIINATVRFHLQNITMNAALMSQEIQVKFVLGNETIDKILKLSGNPGYQDGLPVIVSYAEKNYTETFYNKTVPIRRYFLLPENDHGVCKQTNNSENYILFGRNRRISCRYNHKYFKITNYTDECKNIQNNLNSLLLQYDKVVVSPLGNPYKLKDSEWISIEKSSLFEGPLYGKAQEELSKILCFNLITRYSLMFKYSNLNGMNRIESYKFEKIAKNATFIMEDISTVVTIDISFIDITKPSVIEYETGPPKLNIHLPDDFFYPFHSNESHILKCNILNIILYYYIAIIACK